MESKEIKDGSGIELRSEKIRNFIGEVPSLLVWIGILVNVLVLLLLACGVYCFAFWEH